MVKKLGVPNAILIHPDYNALIKKVIKTGNIPTRKK
jgi:hypothetical protein